MYRLFCTLKSKKSSLFLCTFKIKHYLCIAIEENKSEIRKIVLWCNGSTSVSGTACQGSSPCKTTKNKKLSCGVMVAHQFLALLVRGRVRAGQLKKTLFQASFYFLIIILYILLRGLTIKRQSYYTLLIHHHTATYFAILITFIYDENILIIMNFIHI